MNKKWPPTSTTSFQSTVCLALSLIVFQLIQVQNWSQVNLKENAVQIETNLEPTRRQRRSSSHVPRVLRVRVWRQTPRAIVVHWRPALAVAIFWPFFAVLEV